MVGGTDADEGGNARERVDVGDRGAGRHGDLVLETEQLRDEGVHVRGSAMRRAG